ncbi:type III-A CRISPR-associated protein Cas10/Csm1 [Thermodesulfovibrio thiophilus]|uniref:type III-A CRISPR-associated protein Cas10/Csm1 n=1 Tax=Thermodesulfovibrio thiophilus TaxID=340095 RepID=UPI00179C162E|nr:type III-A CRISPR-associated protein Cas10/Csm1 [Thermodesulfovibrio thiophilus]HHW20433.1 type III-A CRISPR-associated protein Cas10/Csm1 [Thermodesulfovibrio thiophilus]
MVDEIIYKIALAGYLHDIGKFAERAKGEKQAEELIGFFPDEDFLNRHRDLYQPHYQDKYTHNHAVYTAAFIDHLQDLLPKEFNKYKWGPGDSFMNLTAGHHKPETPLQWIIAVADRVSSGFDRVEFEEKYNKEINVKNYKKTRLLTLFEGLSTDNKWKEDRLEEYQYRYPLKELSPYNILPVNSSEIKQIDSEQASKEYRELFFNFVVALTKLSHKENIPLWFEHFDSLFMIYASNIPAATVGYVVPDVSLYDHSKTTSALASALYRYHEETDTINVADIKNYEIKKFLLINGNFYGIQNFIFTEGGSTNKASAKLLRGRSFYISLLSELAADMVCRTIGLPVTSIILNAAGRFTILAHNTENIKNAIVALEDRINNWLIENFLGQASIGFSITEASCNDFVSHNFANLWETLSKEVEKKKYTKFNLTKHGGCVETYLDSFNSELGICPFCGKRPAEKSVQIQDSHACKICHDHIYIGENLVKENKIAITTVNADLEKEKLSEPIFGQYQVSFKITGKLNQLSQSGTLLKYWGIGISEKGEIAKNITAKFINGYVPKYENEDLNDDRYFAGRKSEKKHEEMIDQIKIDRDKIVPKTFAHIAAKALNFTDKQGKFKGIEALGILKADVDYLGLLFACGIKKERLTLSRLATLSRQMDNYFTIFLPYKLKTTDSFKNIYTVFAGGDDLFLIGPWNRIIEFASFLNETFKEYVCHNHHITISAGIAVHKPNTPVFTLAETSEHALAQSKTSGRNSITLFESTAKWNIFRELQDIKTTMQLWLDSEKINNAMIYRINEFINMRKQEQALLENKTVFVEDMECLKWRARLKYSVVRNAGKKLQGDEKQKVINEVMEVANWLEQYGGALRIPLWQIIYNNRR